MPAVVLSMLESAAATYSLPKVSSVLDSHSSQPQTVTAVEAAAAATVVVSAVALVMAVALVLATSVNINIIIIIITAARIRWLHMSAQNTSTVLWTLFNPFVFSSAVSYTPKHS